MIGDTLKQNFSEVTRGLSERSIRLFCSQHEIHKTSDLEVDSIFEDSIREVCIKMYIHNLCGKVATQFIAPYRVLSSFIRLNSY